MVEPRRMRDRAADLLDEEAALAGSLARTWGADQTSSVLAESGAFPMLHLAFDRLLAHTKAPAWTLTAAPEGPGTTVVASMGWNPVMGDSTLLFRQIKNLLDDGYRIILAADGEGSADRLQAVLRDEGMRAEVVPAGYEPDIDQRSNASVQIVIQSLERGFILPSVKLAVLAESDITGRRRAHRKAKPKKRREAQAFFDDLKTGDHVVHYVHGVGKFAGMVKRAIGGVDRDYLLLEFRGDDKLYVPSDQIDAVRPYSGEPPSLHRLGGKDFAGAKAKVRAAVQEIAQELVVLYQKRITAPGHAFGQDTPWQREMEELFPYQETPDQLKAIEDVKADMEAPSPMDRLVCGDVGYGKTEVAIRAIFKAVQDGKQAAILAPTTLLAQQHYQNFTERFANYPLRVEVLSRFLTTKQAKKVIEGVKTGRDEYWHLRHMNEPTSMSHGSIMPAYPHMLRDNIDFGSIQARVDAMAMLNVPYSREALTDAAGMARDQAAELSANLVKRGGPTGMENKDIIAMIAYLQRLGKDMMAGRNQATVAPATPAAAIPAAVPVAVPPVAPAAVPAPVGGN